MQAEAPEAFDLSGETPATHKLYGTDNPTTEIFGKQCLLARRLVERGVRMVQVYHTQTSKREAASFGTNTAICMSSCRTIVRPLISRSQD